MAREIGRAVRALVLTGRELQAALAKRLGLGLTDLQALEELASNPGPIGPAELSKRLGIRSASTSVLVDRLVAAGHLERERHPDDRRRVTLRLTDTSRKEVRAALRPLWASIAEMTADLHPDQARTVAVFLRDATTLLGDITDGVRASSMPDPPAE
jgi:DNA-binding MarR family transcriptional regulator